MAVAPTSSDCIIRPSTGPGHTALTRMPDGAPSSGDLGQADHGVLRGDVGRDAPDADEAGDRRGVDDAPATAGGHRRHHVLQPEEHAAEVDGDDPVERLDRVGHDRGDGALDTGVVEEPVDAAEQLHGDADVALDRGFVGHVGDLDEQLVAGIQLVGQRGAGGDVDVHGQHPVSELELPDAARSSERTTGPGHDDAILPFTHHGPLTSMVVGRYNLAPRPPAGRPPPARERRHGPTRMAPWTTRPVHRSTPRSRRRWRRSPSTSVSCSAG